MSRVVVIDDHDPSRKNLVRILNESGYEVVSEGASFAIVSIRLLAFAALPCKRFILVTAGFRLTRSKTLIVG